MIVETLYSVSQSGKVQSFYTNVGAQGLAPLHMYLTWLGIAICKVSTMVSGGLISLTKKFLIKLRFDRGFFILFKYFCYTLIIKKYT